MSLGGEEFAAALKRARRRKLPVIALRPDNQFPDELDDIVVLDVETFRAEAMSNQGWWMSCRFRNGEELTFWVGRGTKPARVVVTATDVPEHVDWDDLFHGRVEVHTA